MRQRAKDHIRGFIIGVMCLVSCGAIFAWRASERGLPTLSRAERHAAIRAHYVPVEVVKTIERVVEVPGERLPPVVERVEIRIPGERVEIPVEVPVPVPCRPLTIGGGCTIEIIGSGSQRLARGFWEASVSGPDWGPVTRGPVMTDERTIEFAMTEDAAPKKWSRGWWLGAIKTPGGWGPTVAASLTRKRWTAKIGAGLVVDIPSVKLSDGEFYSIHRSTEPVYTLEFGRASR